MVSETQTEREERTETSWEHEAECLRWTERGWKEKSQGEEVIRTREKRTSFKSFTLWKRGWANEASKTFKRTKIQPPL